MFPNASVLKQPHNLGRFRATNLNGDLDNDGKFEKIRSVGARSFSIFNADTKSIVFDSGDDFEMYTAKHYPTIFNSDHEENKAKVRSRAKGPEPEGLTVATIGGQTFAFIALERIGGVMVYNVTDPNNVLRLQTIKTTEAHLPIQVILVPKGIIYIDKADSPNNKGYVIIANEISGTLTIYEKNAGKLSNDEFEPAEVKTFNVFPNPSNGGTVYFSRAADVTVYDMDGRQMFQGKNVETLNADTYPVGIYIVKTKEGLVKKISKEIENHIIHF